MVVVCLARRIHLVGDIDLAGVQHPFAVEAEGCRTSGYSTVAIQVPDLQVRAVDGLFVVRASRHQDRHQDVVVGIANVITGRLLTDDQGPHVDRGHEVGRAEDDRLDPRRGLRDRVDGNQTLGILDLSLDSDPADLEAVGLLDLGEQQVQPLHLGRALHLRQHDRIEVGTGTLDDLDHVAIGPLSGQVVNPYRPDLVAPASLVQGRDNVLAGVRLGQRGDRVLDVEKHLVGRQALGLLEKARVRAGHGQIGATGTQFARCFGHSR